MNLRLPAIASLSALALIGQARIDGPSMGLITDAVARTVRDVEGVPASALMGDPISTGQSMAWIEAAPGRGYALGVDSETGVVQCVTAAAKAALDSVEPSPRAVRFSATGSAAALLYADHAVILSALAERPTESWRLPLPQDADLAVSDDGREAIIMNSGQLTRIGADGTGSEIAASGAARVKFTENSRNSLLIVDSSLTEATTDGSRQWQLPENSGRILDAAASSTQVIALLEGGNLIVWDRASEEPRQIACNCDGKQLTRFGRPGLYRLNDAGDGPVWLLDTADETRILFIPGAARSAE